MSEKAGQVRLMDALQIWNSKEQFESLVDGVITDEDRKLFGDQVRDLVVQSIVYPAAFAVEPATFDGPAYAAVIAGMSDDFGWGELDPDKVNRLMWISLENGVLEMNEQGRFYIPKKVFEKLRPILEQYT